MQKQFKKLKKGEKFVEVGGKEKDQKLGEKVSGLASTVDGLIKKSKDIEFTLDISKYVIIGVIIVLFLFVIGLLVNSMFFYGKAKYDNINAYYELREEMRQNNNLIEQRIFSIKNNNTNNNCINGLPFNNSS